MNKVIPLVPKDAWSLLQENPRSVLIDVRSSMEFLFVGHAQGAISIPWIDEPHWVVDPHWLTHIRQLMLGGVSSHEADDAPIIVICRSGRRSLEAGEKLIEAGFTKVYHIEGGFEGSLDEHHQRSTINGWRYEGLPWEQC